MTNHILKGNHNTYVIIYFIITVMTNHILKGNHNKVDYI